jgi:uncharacterized glyoxalase superfamily protein PhnB
LPVNRLISYRAVFSFLITLNSYAVDTIMKEAEKAGATIVKQPQNTFWGGYAGYFKNLDKHLWEIVWNPAWQEGA